MEPEKIITSKGGCVAVELFPEKADSLFRISRENAEENAEAEIQLVEGCTYEYKITDRYIFEEQKGIIVRSARDKYSGRILPGIYVGTLQLKIVSETDPADFAILSLEVQSVKTSYRNDYRYMLKDIAERCVDLLMLYSSPSVQNYTPDYDSNSHTLYQKFAFVKAIAGSEEFSAAVHKIISSPVSYWKHIEDDADMRKIRRLNRTQIQQIASGSNRVDLPIEHPLRRIPNLTSVPSRITVTSKTSSLDTPENRFVKYVLRSISGFCSSIKDEFAGVNAGAFNEAHLLEEKLNDFLNHSIFKEVSFPATIPLNSPVLQRKEGYREVLRTWLMFDLAAKLIWQGGDDVYAAGKKDVAVLYEYWLFFKLLGILKEIFNLELKSVVELIEFPEKRLVVNLKSGNGFSLKGSYIAKGRNLNVVFSYNKTFSSGIEYPGVGSWTRQMRPDYTISLWPYEFEEEEAERQELITHIHFDSKYRVEDITELFGSKEAPESELDEEKIQQKKGNYKRADLLKMHAYKDAIRRTGGAYVLYPGNDKPTKMFGFREIIPGLGAFPIRPSEEGNDGSEELKSFIKEVADYLCNRASQHERFSYRKYEIHKNPGGDTVSEPLPEHYNWTRNKPPADTTVLVGFVKSRDHYNWINEKGWYNIRIRENETHDFGFASAEYVLLHRAGSENICELRRIAGSQLRVLSKKELLDTGYPGAEHDFYMIFEIGKEENNILKEKNIDISKLSGYKTGHGSAKPFTATLLELINAKQLV